MLKTILAALFLGGLGLSTANAAPVYNTSLVDPPGVYFGAGNNNTGYVTSTVNGMELGLSVLTRFVGQVAPDPSSSVYHVPLGNTMEPGKNGTKWGFTFSANNGANGPTLSQVGYMLSIYDTLNNTTVTFDPLTIPDNSGYGPSGKNNAASNLATDYAVQNGEALAFGNTGGSFFDPLYSSMVDNTFLITLSSIYGNVTNSVSETVIQGAGAATDVPEPASIALLGLGLISIGMIRRKSA